MYSKPLVPVLFLMKGARFDLFYLFFPPSWQIPVSLFILQENILLKI